MNSLRVWIRIAAASCLALTLLSGQSGPPSCNRTIYANVIALDQPIMVNRLGSAIPGGMIYALARDVVKEDPGTGAPTSITCDTTGSQCLPGQVGLRAGKRPRPIVIRASVGDCLVVNLTNLVAPDPSADQLNQAPSSATPGPGAPGQLWGQSNTRAVGFHAAGIELMTPPDTGLPAAPPPPGCTPLRSNGDFVGRNCSSQANPGETRTYKLYAREEGHYLVYSKDDALVADGNAGQIQSGLFGSVTVEPANAEFYRSQVLQTDLDDATYVACSAARTTECVGPGPGQSTGQALSLVENPGVGSKQFTLTMSQSPGQTPKPPTTWTVTVVKDANQRLHTLDGHPVVNYFATYQQGNAAGQPAGTPVLSMLRPMSQPREWELVHSDLTAIVTGPGATRFPDSQLSPLFNQNPALPDRREPFREFTVHYHASSAVVQAFASVPGTTTDSFAINYGIGGIGNEIIANRLKAGASADCVECKFEEFFLSSWVLGDPAMLVDHPSGGISPAEAKPVMNGSHSPASASEQEKNLQIPQTANPDQLGPAAQPPKPARETSGVKATKVFYPDDPSNVYHSYMRDHVKFRISNVSPIQAHVHHQHAHQWLQTPNNDDSAYLDSQLVVPGSTYTLEMTYNGSGNRNQTVGDSIFHCHFYPHFAGGMWALWRVHDVFEAGTTLNADGTVAKPAPGGFNRALPDGEIESGTPIPAVVPLPSLGMAPVPALISLAEHGKRVVVKPEPGGAIKNPGFPFFVPGIAGHRAPHPPLDFAWEENPDGTPKLENGHKVALDGGLPRHMILAGNIVNEFHTRWDFTKDTDGMFAYRLPEDGTAVEKAAMAEHSRRTRPESQPDGQPGNFILNGLPPTSGGPFARPDIDDNGNSVPNTRRYKAAVFQSDVVLNKEGWHYPQQRWLSLWNDIPASLDGSRAPQPLFFRANSGENVEFWHTNLVPSYYEMDDYEVRTPTDILGQHIHLVKFDVLASDGAANGFNYEDGTFAFDEVTDRIKQINKGFGGPGGLYAGHSEAGLNSCLQSAGPLSPCLRTLAPQHLTAKAATAVFPTNPNLATEYTGAQTTIQLWSSDPLLNNRGKDRTLRTVFTHDHYGPSTHQNIGLYAGLLIEPPGSKWFDPIDGKQLGGGSDGGPTDWQANIETPNPAESYREFALEFQDLQEAYKAESKHEKSAPKTVPLFTLAEPTTTFPQDVLALQHGKMPSDIAKGFLANGITLSATPKIIPKASCPTNPTYTWCVQDVRYPANTFGINADTSQTTGQGTFDVFTPTMHPGWADPTNALSSNSKAPDINPGAINSNPATGIYSLNYRNEPLPLRLNQNGGSAGQQTDPAWAFASLSGRNDPKLNKQPAPGTPVSPQSPFRYPPALNPASQLHDADPYTPLLSAYENDRVQIRTLVGAHTMTHSFRMNGLNWLYEPDNANSGYKSAQGMGLSEHFELQFTVPAPVKTRVESMNTATDGLGSGPQAFSDYLYAPSSSMAGLTQGLWGLFRAFDGSKGILPNLRPLPNNPQGHAPQANVTTGCPGSKPPNQKYSVVAVSPQQLGLTGLVYNQRDPGDSTATAAAVYINVEDLQDPVDFQNPKLKSGMTSLEPLILRANAGDCVEVTLTNLLKSPPALRTLPAPFVGGSVPVTVTPSQQAGLQADLMSSNVNVGAGLNVGFNNIGPGALNGTAAPGKTKLLTWYAGRVSPDGAGIPLEFGAVPLVPADPLNQAANGMVGTLVVEPAGSTWQIDPGTRASATITPPGGKPFREFVVILQNALVPFGAGIQSGINYRSEPLALRPGPNPNFLIFGTQTQVSQYVSSLNACVSLAKACPQLATSTLAAALKNPGAFPGNKNFPKGGYAVIPTATVTSENNAGSTGWLIQNGGYSFTIQQTGGNGQLLMVRGPLSNYADFLSNTRVGNADPQTPIFCAAAGQPVRFRVTQPNGDFDHMMVVDGHNWKQEPYIRNSTVQASNLLSQQMGTQVISANEKLDLLIDSAGGPFRLPGDYAYHSFQFAPYGMWGLFRVVPENTPPDKVVACAAR